MHEADQDADDHERVIQIPALQMSLRNHQWDGGEKRDEHAGGGEEIAVARGLRRTQKLDAEDEQNRDSDEDEGDVRTHAFSFS